MGNKTYKFTTTLSNKNTIDSGNMNVPIPVHRGEWVSGTDYNVADIVTFSGGSFWCYVDIPNSTESPILDSEHWHLIAEVGDAGENGATFTPAVSADGVISWTNDKELPNPEPVNIKGGKGDTGGNGATFTPSVSSAGVISWTNDKGLSNPSPVNIKGPKGDTGEAGKFNHTNSHVLCNIIYINNTTTCKCYFSLCIDSSEFMNPPGTSEWFEDLISKYTSLYIGTDNTTILSLPASGYVFDSSNTDNTQIIYAIDFSLYDTSLSSLTFKSVNLRTKNEFSYIVGVESIAETFNSSSFGVQIDYCS